MIDLSALAAAPRLLVEAELKPLQTDRFQPTGFPDLGAAKYKAPDDKAPDGTTDLLLVESAQSMANRAEAVCWDEGAGRPVAALAGLPYVHVAVFDGEEAGGTTSSILEAHRLNSPYVLQGQLADGRDFATVFTEATGHRGDRPVDRAKFAKTLLRYDPAALVHGVFMSNVADGRLRLPRALSAFIEARGVREAPSGGVKNDRMNASADTAKGFGNVPFARTEYTAASITAFFNLDLTLLRSLGLPDEAVRLLQLLALFKVVKLTSEGMRLRTACDLAVGRVQTTAPSGYALPSLADIEADLRESIAACKPHFADPAVTELRYQATEASKKASKKSRTKEQ